MLGSPDRAGVAPGAARPPPPWLGRAAGRPGLPELGREKRLRRKPVIDGHRSVLAVHRAQLAGGAAATGRVPLNAGTTITFAARDMAPARAYAATLWFRPAADRAWILPGRADRRGKHCPRGRAGAFFTAGRHEARHLRAGPAVITPEPFGGNPSRA